MENTDVTKRRSLDSEGCRMLKTFIRAARRGQNPTLPEKLRWMMHRSVSYGLERFARERANIKKKFPDENTTEYAARQLAIASAEEFLAEAKRLLKAAKD